MPVAEYKVHSGDPCAALGRLDMHKLCTLEEEPLRQHIRAVLHDCLPGGRYALGSGNSVANGVPLQN